MKRESEYGQFCPIAMTAQILTAKWMPLVVRELLCGSQRFSQLQKGLPLMSPSLLSTRLTELEGSGLVVKNPAPSGKGYEYVLTEAGQELRPIITMYGFWAEKWLKKEYTEEELDPSLLMWDIRRNVDGTVFPDDRRAVVQFELSGIKKGQRLWWLLFERGDVDLCLRDPGHDIDLIVSSHIRALTEVWMGRKPLTEALNSETIKLEGKRLDARDYAKWFSLNFFAHNTA